VCFLFSDQQCLKSIDEVDFECCSIALLTMFTAQHFRPENKRLLKHLAFLLEPQLKSNSVHFCLKIWQLVASCVAVRSAKMYNGLEACVCTGMSMTFVIVTVYRNLWNCSLWNHCHFVLISQWSSHFQYQVISVHMIHVNSVALSVKTGSVSPAMRYYSWYVCCLWTLVTLHYITL